MRTLLIFITGFVLGLILTELINIFGFLLYNQTIGLKFFPILMGIGLAGMDFQLRWKSKLPNFKSSLR
ncbi:hypothetical protein MLOOGBEN_12470 [Bacillus sp. EB106-08-02-XG196]|jgi:hypothetical protein|uniref:DUF5957 family protein n=1 Tax=Bacillus sp. EB106-08-02-XG196 TaxID=2737049 RepID=UPI0015C4392B|nr:DUF5957 family protein [Bacillus sp. EB106-08-02-XG196]NWQ41507.1 hypothetical protein [Bacillus sp. EB106-08-02-XG196]